MIGWIDVERLHAGEAGLREQPPDGPQQRQAIDAVRPLGHGLPQPAPQDGTAESPQDAGEPGHEPTGADWTPGPCGDRDTQV